ncbi:MAG: hypothetical protein J2P38_00560 [Candidatus Dormibacteraeota bacterium]|nr:hypothetical protein [Candidatus Dormibacteraeota bacterium]
MQTPSTSRWYLNTLARVVLIVGILLAATAVIAFLVPAALHLVAIVMALLVGFAICALPFATVLGIVLLITRRQRVATPAMYGYPPAPGLHAGQRPRPYPQGPRPIPPGIRRGDPFADLPPRLQALAARIRDKATALRDPGQWHLVPPEDQVQLDRIIGEYLPSILHSYRGIPRGTHDWPINDGGPSVVDVVEHQLHLLEQGLDAIADRVFKVGASQLLAQQQFLEDRLGDRPPGELTIP